MRKANANRRAFLKTVAGSVVAGPSLAEAVPSAGRRIRMAFIGLDRTGSRNVDLAARTTGFEIATVCDARGAVLDRAMRSLGRLGLRNVKAARDFREVLEDRSIDAVAIAVPDDWRARMTVAACKAGKDVWVESPACVSVEEGAAIIHAARRYRRVVQGGSIERSGNLFRQVRAIAGSGALGEIVFCRASQTCKSIVDVNRWLLDLVAFAFEDAMPLRIAAQGSPPSLPGGSGGAALVTYGYPKFVASCEMRGPDSAGHREAVICGSEATLLIRGDDYEVYPRRQDGAAKWIPVDGSSGEWEHWRNFRDCIRSRRRPVADIEGCVRSAITCLLTEIAVRHGLTLDWDEQAFTVRQTEARRYLEADRRGPREMEI